MRIKVCIISYLNVCGKCYCLLPISKLHEYFALVISICLGQWSFQRWHWLFCSLFIKEIPPRNQVHKSLPPDTLKVNKPYCPGVENWIWWLIFLSSSWHFLHGVVPVFTSAFHTTFVRCVCAEDLGVSDRIPACSLGRIRRDTHNSYIPQPRNKPRCLSACQHA